MNAPLMDKRITLTRSTATVDDYGHTSVGTPVAVIDVWAHVSQMSAAKTMMTFQQADIIGVEITMRNPSVAFNGIRYNGIDVHFSQPETTDKHGRWLKVTGFYQIDNPR